MRALAAVALLLVVGCGEEPQPAGGAVEEARDLVEFALPGIDGTPIVLSEHRGRTVIVDFWATWCPPCVYQVPELNALQEAHREADDLTVIGVSVDIDGAEVVGPWVEEHGVAYPIALGDEQLANEFGAVGFPTLAVVSHDGSIHSLHVGLIELDELEELVAAAAP